MEELQITTERVDDVPLLLGVMQRIGLVKILDNHIPSHWKQRELSWGWTAVIWLAYILTEGDHRKSSGRIHPWDANHAQRSDRTGDQ